MVSRSMLAEVEVGGTSVADALRAVIAAHGVRNALIDGASGASITYAELGRRIDRIAAWLARDGVRAGDCIALWMPNTPPFAAFTIAAFSLGAVVTALNPAATDHEITAQLRDARAKLIVTVPALVDRAVAFEIRVVTLGPSHPAATALADVLATSSPAPRVAVDPAAVALLPYSSGTTGTPKGVMLSHANLVTACRQIARAIEVDARDVTLAIAPFFHILGFTAELLVPLLAGATVVTLPRFEPVRALELLAHHRVTYVAIPPPVAMVLARHPAVAEHDLSNLQLVACGGAALGEAVHRELAARLPGCAIGQGWGLTETTGAVSVPSRRAGTREGTVGKPVPNTEVKVVDPITGASLGACTDGELWVRGPQTMLGYLGHPDATAALITADGWLRTGDLGHIEEDGDIVIVDRIKELIKVNALQVAPAEVEAVLASHPAIVDAAVTGRPDARCGEVPIAYVVLREPIDHATLDTWIRERLAPYKRPVEVVRVETLPRSPSGKLQRRMLAALAEP